MEDVERASERLENIRSVRPILGALRTISLGSWQASLKRRSGVLAYSEHLNAMLPWLIPQLKTKESLLSRLRRRLPLPQADSHGSSVALTSETRRDQYVALAIGSERGLCGRFNISVAEETDRYVEETAASGVSIQLTVLGSRAERILRRRGRDPSPAGTLSMTSLPPLSLAFDLARRWLTAYEEEEIDAVDLIYNRYRGTGAYKSTVTRLIPPLLTTQEETVRQEPHATAPRGLPSAVSGPPAASWPPPIIDTDPLSLYASVLEQFTVVHLYTIMLESSAAEHATRFQLMESATQNADRLIEELSVTIQTARRHEITQEMAELAVGAGLLEEE